MTEKSKQLRNKMIATIHVAKKQLALSEDNYRALLIGATDKDSLRDMNIDDLKAVIERLKKFGFKKPKPKRSGKRKMANTEYARLIRALWLSLYHLGEVRDPSEEAMTAYVKRMTKIDDLKWLTDAQAQKSITGLRDWMRRAGYIRPTDKSFKYYFLFNNYDFNTDEVTAHVNAAHVLMAQSRIAFKEHEEFVQFLSDEGVVIRMHPYSIPMEEIYILTEKLGTKIRKAKGINRG